MRYGSRPVFFRRPMGTASGNPHFVSHSRDLIMPKGRCVGIALFGPMEFLTAVLLKLPRMFISGLVILLAAMLGRHLVNVLRDLIDLPGTLLIGMCSVIALRHY